MGDTPTSPPARKFPVAYLIYRMKHSAREKLLYICDWLPPDYGAVGQYSVMFARQLAEEGREVTLLGLSSRGASESVEMVGNGQLRIVKLAAASVDKSSQLRRMLWTAVINTRLLWFVCRRFRDVNTVLFTGSPPLLIHWLGPLNVLLRRRLIYRITDFHPECAIAQRGSANLALRLLLRLTIFWRRRVDAFEVLGEDQAERLRVIGIDDSRIALKRDPSPVQIGPGTLPLPRPTNLGPEQLLLLYSGNWGVAHDYQTFIAGYAKHHRVGTGRFILWLNAVGAAVESIVDALTRQELPFIRGTPVPLHQLASLLVTPDAHLITLSDAFVGYVLPSKVHGCISSQRPILFVGSEKSDVHLLCRERARARYERVDVGDTEGCWRALERLAQEINEQRTSPVRKKNGEQ